MASDTAKTIREEATCSICLDLMTKPVIIDCGHIFCHSCIIKSIQNQSQGSASQGNIHCPVCRAQFQRESIRSSKQLENLIDTIRGMEQEHMCKEHGEKLHLFCEDDGQLICWRCERTPQHRGHTTALATDACQGYKENFQKTLAYLRELEDQNKEWQEKIREGIKNFQLKMLHEKKLFQFGFKEFHKTLHMEENSYLWRLENETEKVLKRLQHSEAKLEKQSQELNHSILELERKCEGSAQDLLQDAADTLDRTSAMKLNAPEDVSLDIHIESDFYQLFDELIKCMKTYNVIISLDPDTAHSDLHVNENKNEVTGGSPQVKHDTPTRFKDLPCVLGCEVLASGKHYFEVCDIRGSLWDVGVCLEDAPRDNDMTRDPESGFWAIRHCGLCNYAALTSSLTPLHLEEKLKCIGVFVDYEVGLVSFYNTETGSHIFTFPKASFSQPLRPYFQIGESSYLCTGYSNYA